MFRFFRRPAPRPLSDAIRRAIEQDGMTSSFSSPSLLRMVESGGRYADRKVTYFRIFDPALAAHHSLDVRRFQDLDGHGSLILRAGHVERDGAVILTRPVVVRAAATPIRTQADRTQHADDAHIVVLGETGASANPRAVGTSASEQTS
jgi:hypothetical protein